jgi:hypothetical protein
VADGVTDAWRDAKHYASAALASARLMMTERGARRLLAEEEEDRARRRERAVPGGGGRRLAADDDGARLASDGDDEDESSFSPRDDDDGNFDDEDVDDDDGESLERELRFSRLQKAHSALLSAHQLEALWKITKIELDRTIREACRWILGHYGEEMGEGGGGWNVFCHPFEVTPDSGGDRRHHHRRHHPYSSPPPPPLPPPPPPPPPFPPGHNDHQFNRPHRGDHTTEIQERPRGNDGWVGTTGEVVTTETGRLRAAAAMILVGDIFVHCSKEGTAWNKR